MRSLTLKTLKHEKIEVMVEDGATVIDIKRALERERPTMLADGQKLVFKGKKLNDDEKPDFGPTDFMVVIYKAPTAGAARSVPAASTPVAAESSGNAAANAAASSGSASGSANAGARSPVSSGRREQRGARGNAATRTRELEPLGEEAQRMVDAIVSMGFERSQVEIAVRIGGVQERAVELLVSGADMGQLEAQLRAAPAEDESDMDEDEDGGEEGDGPAFQWLRSIPQFEQLRAAVQANPHMLQPLLQRLAEVNPDLVSEIAENQNEFMNLLNEPISDEARAGFEAAAAQQGGAASNTIQVSPEEREAIERLTQLGFDRNVVIQAYFACEKDENVTANYLLEHGHELQDFQQ